MGDAVGDIVGIADGLSLNAIALGDRVALAVDTDEDPLELTICPFGRLLIGGISGENGFPFGGIPACGIGFPLGAIPIGGIGRPIGFSLEANSRGGTGLLLGGIAICGIGLPIGSRLGGISISGVGLPIGSRLGGISICGI